MRITPMGRLAGALVIMAWLAMSLVWVAMAWLFPVGSLATVAHIDLGKLTFHQGSAALGWGAWLGGAWAVFGLVAWAWPRLGRGGRSVIAAGWLVAIVGALFTYPLTAADVFDYLGHATLLSDYGINPLVESAAAALPEPRLVGLMAWPDTPSVYGPLWLQASRLALLGDGGVAAATLAFKLIGLLGLVATGVAVAALARLRGLDPWLAVFLVVSNPLAIWEVPLVGHNDIWMVALMTGGLALWLGGVRVAGILAVGLAVLVKFVAGVLALPLAVDALRRGRWAVASLLLGGLAALLAALALYAPFWEGGRVIEVLRARSGVVGISLPAVLAWLGDEAAIGTWLSPLMTGLTIACGVALAWIAWLQWRGRLSLLAACGWVVLAVLGLGLGWFQSWYVLWLLPFAATAGDRRLAAAGWAVAISSMATYLVFQWWPLWRESGVPFGWAQLFAWLLVWLPVGVAMVVSWRHSRAFVRPTTARSG